jgi:membrane-anchored protein YejM (alkaline phosphatase superfamily)
MIALPALLVFFATQIAYAWHDAKGNVAITAQARYVPWFAPVTMKRALRRMGVDVKTGQAGTLAAHGGSSLRYPLQPLECEAVPRPLHVLVLMVDALRFDMLDAQTMPKISAFAQTAIRFENHFSTGNSTRFGVFGFFYGLPASYWNAMLSEQRPAVLMDRLQALDYSIYVEASAPLISPEFDRTVFAKVRDRIHWAPSSLDIADRDRHATNSLNQKIASHDPDKPFFGFLFLDAPHSYGLPRNYDSPFQPMLDDVNYLSLGPDTDPERFFNRYRASVHYNDGLLASVIDTLRRGNLLDDTVIIITSDHGQEFNDLGKNYWGHNSNYSDFQIRVPMVVHWPGRATAAFSTVTSHEDVAPTLMQELLGCKNATADYSTGRNLFLHDDDAESQQRALVVESWSDRAIVQNDRIFQFPGFGAAQVFDRRYNPINGEVPSADLVNQVLRQMSTYLQ